MYSPVDDMLQLDRVRDGVEWVIELGHNKEEIQKYSFFLTFSLFPCFFPYLSMHSTVLSLWI